MTQAASPGLRPRRFLTAEWRHLLMLNYPVERALLEPLVPPGTSLDTFQGRAYVSLVGFLFLKTRVLGVPVSFHRDFEEVNLRFYVRRFADGDWRRGVVFIKEIVPKAMIAAIARAAYNEAYVALPMRHRIELQPDGVPASVEFGWQQGEAAFSLRAKAANPARVPRPGSLEEFITEHYWGYVRQRDGGCVEYQVEHPRWRVWTAVEAKFEGDATSLYGGDFATALRVAPASAFIAEGSVVTVFKGVRL